MRIKTNINIAMDTVRAHIKDDSGTGSLAMRFEASANYRPNPVMSLFRVDLQKKVDVLRQKLMVTIGGILLILLAFLLFFWAICIIKYEVSFFTIALPLLFLALSLFFAVKHLSAIIENVQSIESYSYTGFNQAEIYCFCEVLNRLEDLSCGHMGEETSYGYCTAADILKMPDDELQRMANAILACKFKYINSIGTKAMGEIYDMFVDLKLASKGGFAKRCQKANGKADVEARLNAKQECTS